MLQIKNLTITHKKDLRTILNDFTFSLNPGDKAVIIGEEGNGKSTLLKLIYDEALISDYAEYTGTIRKGTPMRLWRRWRPGTVILKRTTREILFLKRPT